MASAARAHEDSRTRTTLDLLAEFFGEAYARAFSVVLWDGTRIAARQTERFVFRVNEPGALRAALTPPLDLSFGRAFAAGLISLDGDLESAIDELYCAAGVLRPGAVLKIALLTRRLPRATLPSLREARLHGRLHSPDRDRAAIGFHYDLPVAFYRTFLDEELTYSCAYYDDGIETLDAAQSAKLDYLLRKLRLRPGERLLDIGCGWGGLVVRAAERFGATALGITLSRAQYEAARERIARAGVEGRAAVALRDYRELGSEQFDKIVSVGMFEHVGHAQLPTYFKAAYDALLPGGLFLNHGIASQDDGAAGKVSGFMERCIFPDGELVPIAESLRLAEAAGLEVRDVENLREHYVRTLRAWVANLESHRAAAVALVGEPVYRSWRLYMAGSAQGFRVGRLGLYQALLARRRGDGSIDAPATRRDLYAS